MKENCLSSSHELRPPVLPVLVAVVIGVLLAGLRGVPAVLPYTAQDALDGLKFSMVIQDVQGGELQVLPLQDGLRRQFVPLEDFPDELVEVVLAAEDRRFWLHPGVDLPGLLRALWQNLTSGSTVSGASTISMQLARLLKPRPQRNSLAKLAEMAEALQLESRLGKRGILELYLNLVPFGRNVEGFPAAARVFFGKTVGELDQAEAMILAVIPRSPGIYDPLLQQANNRKAALRLATASTIVPPGVLDVAYLTLLDPQRSGIWPFRAPQFVEWLKTRQEFKTWDTRKPLITGIEPRLQSWLEDLLFRTVQEASRKRVSNASALFVRPDTMGIAAWVGSIDFDDAEHAGQVDGVRMLRQPGSTLKPFLYAMALGKGVTASTILPDIPQDFGGAEVYTPANFNDQFNGPVRLRQALASSLNVPAVHTLQRMGVMPFTDFLIKAGFKSLAAQRGHLGLGLSLGNAEVSLYELVQAYGIFLHHGTAMDLTVCAGGAGVAGTGTDALMSPGVADLVRDILTRHPDRTLAFGRNSNTRMKFEGAMKTGTSNQFNNIWAIGFTPDLLGGVWMGNFSGNTVVGTADSGYPARMVNRTLEAFSAHKPFEPVQGLERARICSLSGKGAGTACPFAMDELFLPGTQPGTCDWHRSVGGAIQTSYPQEYRSWMNRYRYRGVGTFSQSSLQIVRPRDKAVFFLDSRTPDENQELAVEAVGTGTGEIWLDGTLLVQTDFPIKIWIPLQKGEHVLELKGLDGEGKKAGDRVRYVIR